MTAGKWTPPERLTSSAEIIREESTSALVAQVGGTEWGLTEERALAAELVHRWNAHTALVAALNAAANLPKCHNDPCECGIEETHAQIRAALTLARKES